MSIGVKDSRNTPDRVGVSDVGLIHVEKDSVESERPGKP